MGNFFIDDFNFYIYDKLLEYTVKDLLFLVNDLLYETFLYHNFVIRNL